MIFFRIARAADATAAAAFSGLGATLASHRWTWARPQLRAVYGSDSLPLACLEVLVHLRPSPRTFRRSVYYEIEIPDGQLERIAQERLPAGWDRAVPVAATRDLGTAFLEQKRAVGLVVPTAILPLGSNVLLNPLHPSFSLRWVRGPWAFRFDGRLE